MHGNVWEWCEDWYADYKESAVDDPTGAATGWLRVMRGGSWIRPAGYCRSRSRNLANPGSRSRGLGLRVSRVPGGQVKQASERSRCRRAAKSKRMQDKPCSAVAGALLAASHFTATCQPTSRVEALDDSFCGHFWLPGCSRRSRPVCSTRHWASANTASRRRLGRRSTEAMPSRSTAHVRVRE